MAEIDKSLPNQPEDIKLEDINEVETVSEEETPSTDEVEVITTEDMNFWVGRFQNSYLPMIW
jgi:hypothetical protein